jgi:dTDP-4-amino-4,6-dideoxygalactose transaminase
MHTGATPVLCDVEPDSYCIDPAQVEARITPRTRALLVVHMAGRPCDMDALMAIADRHGLWVVEDCAHAVDATWRGRPAGSIGHVGCFSFYTTKNVTSAEGGMVTTRDPALAARIRRLALHGMSIDAWGRFGPQGYRHYDVDEPGFKMNLTDLASALALTQLDRLEEIWRRRRAIWETYDAELAGLPLRLPTPWGAHVRHAYHLYTPLVDATRLRVGRDKFIEALHAEGIGTGVHYRAVSTLRYARERLGTRQGDFPVAQHVGANTVSLPIATWMTADDVADVVRAIRRITTHYAA